MKNITLLIMAAGMGSRYGGLKQLDSVGPNGETIIDYSVLMQSEQVLLKLFLLSGEILNKILKKKLQINIKMKFKLNLPFRIFMICLMGISALSED